MYQPRLSRCSLTSKYTKNTFLLCLWPLKESRFPFMLSFSLKKQQPHVFSTFQTSKYVKQTWIQAFVPVKMWCVHEFLHLKLEKHHSYLFLCFLTTVDYIYYFFQGFSAIITYSVPFLFIYSVQKRHCCQLKGTFFVVCLSLNTFFVPFSGVLTCKYIKHTYPVAVYILNTWSTPYCLFLTTKNALLTFHAVVSSSKHQPYLFSNWQISKYVRRYLVCSFSTWSQVLSTVCDILTYNGISRTNLVAFWRRKT